MGCDGFYITTTAIVVYVVRLVSVKVKVNLKKRQPLSHAHDKGTAVIEVLLGESRGALWSVVSQSVRIDQNSHPGDPRWRESTFQ